MNKETGTERESNIIEKKIQNFVICSNMDGPQGHYIKWNKHNNKSEKTRLVRKILYDLLYLYGILKNKLIEGLPLWSSG